MANGKQRMANDELNWCDGEREEGDRTTNAGQGERVARDNEWKEKQLTWDDEHATARSRGMRQREGTSLVCPNEDGSSVKTAKGTLT